MAPTTAPFMSRLVLALVVVTSSSPAYASEAEGAAARGRALADRFQCNRCHDGNGLVPAPRKQHCVHCHQAIQDGRYKDAPVAVRTRWRENVTHFLEVPSLDGMRGRLSPSWIARYLQEPGDVRPYLGESMPRLPLSADEARDLAIWLAGDDDNGGDAAVAFGDATRGRALLEDKRCGSCHRFTGVEPLPMTAPPSLSPDVLARGMKLAPDLALTRDRFVKARLVEWIANPRQLKPDTAMPTLDVTDEQARDMAAYIVQAKLSAFPRAVAPRLPVLQRSVRYDEVAARITTKTCQHCHLDPLTAGGDGGAGATGGFGYEGRHLDVSSYRGLLSGSVDDDGARRSLFERLPESTPVVGGLPRIVAHLMARKHEEAGRPIPGVRGMPLGLPSLPDEDIQLLETWIAQGRPR